jgi:glutaminyl-tRNA synthetase
VDVALLEDAVRDDLNRRAPRAMAVLRPLKVVIENFPEEQVEIISLPRNPDRLEDGSRAVPFSRELYIERDDFMEEPPKQFFRLAPGREVRLRGTYFLTCQRVVRNGAGEIAELRCTYDPATRDGNAPDGRKPKATIHWVSARHAVPAEARLYDRLFTNITPGDDADGGNWRTSLNPASLEVVGCQVDPNLAGAKPGDRFQFERLGYFCVDPDSAPGRLVFNRTVTLKDTWARVSQRAGDQLRG